MTLLDNAEHIIAVYPAIAFAVVFLAGVLSSASPCVLATIPLVVGLAGGYADGDRGKAFRYSLAFVLGLALTFTVLGAAAGMFGTMFGALGGRWFLIAGIVALVMGGQLMGLYELRLPVTIDYRPGLRGGITGAFLLGLFFGVVSSPCATPVLVILLTVVATKGQVLYGVALLFTYAIGHCLMMLAAGTFTGFVESVAKARGFVNFSIWTKRVGGLFVTVVGGYLVFQSF